MSRIVLYQKQVEKQKKIPFPLAEINRKKKYKVEKIMNRRDVREKQSIWLDGRDIQWKKILGRD